MTTVTALASVTVRAVMPLVLTACAGSSHAQHIQHPNKEPVMSTSAANQPAPTRAIRLIFEFDGDQVRLISQQQVDMAVTGFDLPPGDRPGYYVDVRDAARTTLARVAARNAFSGSTEVFPEKPGELITRIDVPRPQGAFTVVVPAPANAQHVTVVRVVPGQPAAAMPSGGATSAVPGAAQVTDLANFPLTIGP